MADSLLQSSISAVRTKIINDISSASVKDLLQLARAAKGLGLGDDTSVETAINTRVNQLSTNATIAEIKDLSSAIKQVRNEYANTINSSDDIVEGQNQRFLSTASLNAELSSLTGDIIPDADLARNIGNAGKKFTSIYAAKVTGLQSPLDSNDAATKAYVDSNASSVETSDTAPTNPNNGDMWFKSDTLDLYVYYTDANSSQWVQVGGSTEVSGPASSGTTVTVYADISAFPTTNNTTGDFAFAEDTKGLYLWDGAEWDRVYAGNDTDPTWNTELDSNGYELASDGTATVVTVEAVDPEGFPISYIAQTNPSNQTQATITQSDGQFTVTPSTDSANEGSFVLRIVASDGVRSITSSANFILNFIPQWAFTASEAVPAMAGQTYNHGTEIYRSNAILLSPDGTKLYVNTEGDNGNIRTYPLSTPYDISSSSVGAYVAGQTFINAAGDFKFNGDGTTVWYRKGGNTRIYATNLVTAYDVTVRDGNEYNAGTGFGSNVLCFTFDRTGDKVFVVTADGNFRGWELSTAYDISSLTYASPIITTTVATVFGNGNGFNSIQFNELGTVIYGMPGGGPLISVPLSTAYDLSTAGTPVSETPAGTGSESSAFFIPSSGEHVYVVRGMPVNTNAVKTSRYTL